MRDDIVMAYVTCSSLEEARRIGTALVEQRLAACVNLRAHEAIYLWQGAVEHGPEHALIAKTTQARFPELRDRVVALHSATLPCVVAVPVTGGHDAFLDWIADQTGAA